MVKIQTLLYDGDQHVVLERACLEVQFVQSIGIVGLAGRDANETRYGAPQVQQHVQLDCRLGGAKRFPPEHRQTQVDGGGVERGDRPPCL